MLYAGSIQQFPLAQPPVVQSSNTSIDIDKLSAVHVDPTVTLNLIVKGPVDDVPQPAVPEFTNLHPGPKLKPLGYVFCKSHIQNPVEPKGLPGVNKGIKFVQPAPKFI
jgi:hypothetical protein